MNTTPRASAAVASLLLLLSPALAEPPPAPKADPAKLAAVGERMKEFVDKKEISGAVTLVATREGVAHVEAVGRADVQADMAMRPDTVFWIASMTKPITATAVLMLQEEGKLSVDDPVAKFLPELANLKTPSGNPANLTLRHLLTHTSGLGEATQAESNAAKTLADLVPAYAAKPMQFEPGSKWSYCQSGINSLGRIIEVASGQSLPDFFQKRLFEPLGMSDTTFYPTRNQLGRLAKSYRRAGEQLEAAPTPMLRASDPTTHDRYPAANGGLFSTAPDYAKFCRMILNGGSLDGKQYLKPESVKLMTTIQTGDIVTGFTPGNGWGLGWCVVREPQNVTAALSPGTHGHGGAYGTQAWIDPRRGLVYVLMIQRSNFGNQGGSDGSDVRKVFQDTAAAAFGK